MRRILKSTGSAISLLEEVDDEAADDDEEEELPLLELLLLLEPLLLELLLLLPALNLLPGERRCRNAFGMPIWIATTASSRDPARNSIICGDCKGTTLRTSIGTSVALACGCVFCCCC